MPISASKLVSITPRVLSGAGTDLTFNGLLLTKNKNLPNENLKLFENANAVGSFFGLDSQEYKAATCYFNGFDNSDVKPSGLYAFRHNSEASAAFVRSGQFSGTMAQTLEELKTIINGTLTLSMVGEPQTVNGIDLSVAGSLSDVASIVQAAIRNAAVDDTAASNDYATALATGVAGNLLSISIANGEPETTTEAKKASCKYGDAKTAGVAGNDLQVAITGSSGAWKIVINQDSDAVYTKESYAEDTINPDDLENDYVEFKAVALAQETVDLEGGADAVTAATYVVKTLNDGQALDTQTVKTARELTQNTYVRFNSEASLTVGNYPLTGGANNGQGAWEGATVEYSSNLNAFTLTAGTTGADVGISDVSGNVADGMFLTADLGATFSEGSDSRTYTETLNAAINNGTNWVTFTTVDNVTTDEIVEMSEWSNARYNEGTQFLYVFYDTDEAMFTADPSATAAAILQDLNVNGVCGVYGDVRHACFIMGSIASISWDRPNSTITLAYKTQSGLGANVVRGDRAQALENLQMNFIGDYASRNSEFILHQPGCMFGPWSWIDSYINSVWLTNALQVQILSGFQTVKRVPYNNEGYTFIRAWCADVIERGITNGVISTGVNLSQTQITALQQEAGQDISTELFNNGYFLQILDATANVRQGRESPTCSVWYTDAGSVHRISMPVTTVQ